MPDQTYPDIHNHFHLYEAPGPEYLAALAALTAEVAAQSADIAALTAQVTALSGGAYSLAQSINILEDKVAIDLSGLITAVEENTTVDGSAKAAIEGLADKVEELAAQLAQEPAVQAALNDLVSNIRSSSGDLAAAIPANTPEEPPVEPPVEEGGVTDDGTEITPTP